MIIFASSADNAHNSPFGVGQITAVKSKDDLQFRWLVKKIYEHKLSFKSGGYDKKGVPYYSHNALAKFDVAITSDETRTTASDGMLYARGDD